MIAAYHANAQKSTGPRRKARVTINALKHGGYAGRLFRSHLVLAREDVAPATGCTVRFAITSAPSASLNVQAERLARKAWCTSRKARREGLQSGQRPPARSSVWCLLRVPTSRGGSGTKPIYVVKSTDSRITFPLRIRIEIPKTGIRLRFWVHRPRMVWPCRGHADSPDPLESGTLQKKVLLGGEPSGGLAGCPVYSWVPFPAATPPPLFAWFRRARVIACRGP